MGKLIGITGMIGAGKSVVSRLLRLKGYAVYDCDSRAKQLMDVDVQLIADMKQRWGSDIQNQDGSLNRPLIAAVIFSDHEQREWLNSRVHALVVADLAQWVVEQIGVCFVEAAILASSGTADYCSQIWVVDAPRTLRLQRALQRGGISQEDLIRRDESQRQELDALDPLKVHQINNGPDSAILPQVDLLLSQVLT